MLDIVASVGALAISIGLWAHYAILIITNSQNSIGNYLEPYTTCAEISFSSPGLRFRGLGLRTSQVCQARTQTLDGRSSDLTLTHFMYRRFLRASGLISGPD